MFGIWGFFFVARWVEMCRTKDEEEDDFARDASVLFKTIIDVCETVTDLFIIFPRLLFGLC